MVIVKLMGGLGNQLFQFAAGFALAKRHSVEVKVDLSFLQNKEQAEGFTYRNYELSCFKKVPFVASAEEIEPFFNRTENGNMFLRLIKKTRTPRYFHYREGKFSFDERFFELPGDSYIEGFFQSENYFIDSRNALLKQLDFRLAEDDINLQYIPAMLEQNSVAVHIRRGDYINNKTTTEYHGVCGIEYYMKGMNYIMNRVANPIYYIFSDDIDWVKKELDLSHVKSVIIDHNQGENSYKDLFLMNHCRHSIIANSSFSWWGAWLNRNPSKIVVAPKKWFNVSIDTSDLLPKTWIKL